MRVVANRKSFLGAFETAGAFVSPRSSSQVIQGIKMIVDVDVTRESGD